MKTTILALTAILAAASGIWVRAQQNDQETPGGSAESKAAMAAQCRHICAIKYDPESPGSLLAWKQELNLTEDQAARLRGVEEKATNDAQALLTAEQQAKLKELAKSAEAGSMMQCMQAMKNTRSDAMPMCCSPKQHGHEHPSE